MTKKARQKRATGKDIAALAGVSQSTVSRVLSSEASSPLISEETASRVKEIARSLGYSPNPIARALRGEKTNLIGLVVREIADPFFAGIIAEISSECRRMGFSVILGYFDSEAAEEMQITRVLDSRQCDGMIFLGDLNDDMKYINEVLDEGHPAVTLCWGQREERIPSVNCNNESGVLMMIEHLLELGHKDFVFVDGGFIGDIRERRTTFLRLGEKYPGLSLSIIQAERNSFGAGYKAMQTLLERQDIPTAVMAADDGIAVGVLSAIRNAGLDVPGQISVSGFDDIELSRYIVPSLTTVRQPIEDMAKEAVRMLNLLINRQVLAESEMYVSLRPELIIRDSTGKPSPR
jgi:DNA-binding LacI/PurR family transcriptional regulator